MTPIQASAQTRYEKELKIFSLLVMPALTLYGLKTLHEFVQGRDIRNLIFGAALLGQVLNHALCLLLLRSKRFALALRLTCLGILMVYAAGALHSQNSPLIAVMPLMGVALALPHIDTKALLFYMGAAWLLLLLNLAGLHYAPMPASGTLTEQAVARFVSTSSAVVAILLLLWQVKNNLQLSESELEQAEGEAEAEYERYRLILDNAREGIAVFATDSSLLIQNDLMKEFLSHDDSGVKDMLFKRCVAGESVSHEFQLNNASEQRWVLLNANPLKDQNGQITGALAIAADITEVKRAQERLSLALGSEAEGRLAGGIAHDMNNVLAVINGASELLARQIDPSQSEARAALERVRRPATEASAVIKQLLAFRRAPENLPPSGTERSGHEKILLVDDEAAVRGVTARMLKLFGYKVVEAASAAEAFTIYTLGGADLLLTDILMPGTSGTALAQRLRNENPDLAVLFTSGFSGVELPGPNVPLARSLFIAKPFSAVQLAENVREALRLATSGKTS